MRPGSPAVPSRLTSGHRSHPHHRPRASKIASKPEEGTPLPRPPLGIASPSDDMVVVQSLVAAVLAALTEATTPTTSTEIATTVTSTSSTASPSTNLAEQPDESGARPPIRGGGPQGRRTRSPLGRQVRPSSHRLGRRRRVEHLGRAGDEPRRLAPCRLG